jgi:hypothetical protein
MNESSRACDGLPPEAVPEPTSTSPPTPAPTTPRAPSTATAKRARPLVRCGGGCPPGRPGGNWPVRHRTAPGGTRDRPTWAGGRTRASGERHTNDQGGADGRGDQHGAGVRHETHPGARGIPSGTRIDGSSRRLDIDGHGNRARRSRDVTGPRRQRTGRTAEGQQPAHEIGTQCWRRQAEQPGLHQTLGLDLIPAVTAVREMGIRTLGRLQRELPVHEGSCFLPEVGHRAPSPARAASRL